MQEIRKKDLEGLGLVRTMNELIREVNAIEAGKVDNLEKLVHKISQRIAKLEEKKEKDDIISRRYG